MRRRALYVQKWHAEQYDEDRFGNAFGRHLRDQEVDPFLSMLQGDHGRVVDVGAGTGKLSLLLSQQFRQVISLDSSSEMLRIARGRAKEDARRRLRRLPLAHLPALRTRSLRVHRPDVEQLRLRAALL